MIYWIQLLICTEILNLKKPKMKLQILAAPLNLGNSLQIMTLVLKIKSNSTAPKLTSIMLSRYLITMKMLENIK